ncbi:uncharacterized protein E6C27_scaffold428G00890 [Cucumis melo var. makuwa]|uniref:Uncharacterized protein n=1 Tax=Cucumis melo var. makuwa TaxID=1194695 RepID=A0A5A7UIZ0_CUCMM|nr:uncharacterized protein E6C27_scaffold428G00890 [Cucumis melo var. makuwa]
MRKTLWYLKNQIRDLGDSTKCSYASTLGMPFLQGESTMRFNDEKIKFNVVNAMKFPMDDGCCYAIESLGCDYCGEEVYFELFSPEEFFEEEDPS